jgi:hypothetical protein
VVNDGAIGGAGNVVSDGRNELTVNGMGVADASVTGPLMLAGENLSVRIDKGQTSFTGANSTFVIHGLASLSVASTSSNNKITVDGSNTAIFDDGANEQLIINGDNTFLISGGDFCRLEVNGQGNVSYWNCTGLVATLSGSHNTLATQGDSSADQLMVAGDRRDHQP